MSGTSATKIATNYCTIRDDRLASEDDVLRTCNGCTPRHLVSGILYTRRSY